MGTLGPLKSVLVLKRRGHLCCYGSANFENTAFRSFSSNVLHEMCPMHQYLPPRGKKIWIYHFLADLIEDHELFQINGDLDIFVQSIWVFRFFLISSSTWKHLFQPNDVGTALSAMEWFQRQHHQFFWNSQEGKWLYWCDPGQWRWTSSGFSQDGSRKRKPSLQKYFER